MQTALNTDENRAFLTWLHELWEEELLDHDGFTTMDTLRQITDSDAVMTYGVFFGPTPLNLVPASALDEYVLLPPLEYQGQQIYRDLLGDVVPGSFALTSACQDPETMLRWVDYLYSVEGSRLAQSGLEGVEYTINADGTWYWIADIETVASSVLADATIADGANTPGYYPVELQLSYDSSDTQRMVSAMQELKTYTVLPYPMVYLSAEDQARVNEIQLELGSYSETAMIRFVTGDIPLDDSSWSAYTSQLENLHLQEMLTIWQKAVD